MAILSLMSQCIDGNLEVVEDGQQLCLTIAGVETKRFV